MLMFPIDPTTATVYDMACSAWPLSCFVIFLYRLVFSFSGFLKVTSYRYELSRCFIKLHFLTDCTILMKLTLNYFSKISNCGNTKYMELISIYNSFVGTFGSLKIYQ